MTALAELQRRFRAALLEGDESGIERDVRHDGLSAAKRLQIYRNNARLLLTEALKANFPATCRIADERFFAYAAAEFIRRHPPRQPRLAEYGSELPDFLAGFAPAAGLPWLADLARLEWTRIWPGSNGRCCSVRRPRTRLPSGRPIWKQTPPPFRSCGSSGIPPAGSCPQDGRSTASAPSRSRAEASPLPPSAANRCGSSSAAARTGCRCAVCPKASSRC
jgi:hypothetical protein